MNNTRVSIIIPCYNQAKYLEETLYSILNQTYSNWECLIVNDGSSDETEQIAKQFTARDKRFNCFFKENGGLSSARNFGLNKSTGTYIQFLDSDDFIDNAKLELSINELNKPENTDKKLAISNFRMFVNDINNSSEPYCVLKSEFFNFESILYKWEEEFTIPIHCGFFDASLFQTLRFNENLKAKEDWVMWVQLFQSNLKTVFINQPLALYRKNPESMTATKVTLNDYLKAYDYIRTLVPAENFNYLLKAIISKYFIRANENANKLSRIKKSKTYRTAFFIKNIAVKLKLLGIIKLLSAKFFKDEK